MSDATDVEEMVEDEEDLDLDDVEPDEADFEESLEELEAAELEESFDEEEDPAVAAAVPDEPEEDPEPLDAEGAGEATSETIDEPTLVLDDEDDLEVDEGLREGEFICASCYLAKGPTQLANAKRSLCVDCA